MTASEKGEAIVWYEDRGSETLKAGSVHLPLPAIKHSVESRSDVLEVIETTSLEVCGTELGAAE